MTILGVRTPPGTPPGPPPGGGSWGGSGGGPGGPKSTILTPGANSNTNKWDLDPPNPDFVKNPRPPPRDFEI